jgi:hypothetical protein
MGKWYDGLTPWASPAGAELPEGVEVETRQPTRPASILSDVAVPALQAGISGAVISALFVFLVSELVPWRPGPGEILTGTARSALQ